MRINKYIAHAGIASRRKAEDLIKRGLVTINGKVVTELATTVKAGDVVEVMAPGESYKVEILEIL